jgi:oligopeptide transport system substrate-binding protein
MKPAVISKIMLLLVALITAFTLAGCASSKVSLSSLIISPEKVSPGNPITIAANLLNSGNDIDYQVELKINNSKTETKNIHIPAGETKAIDFQYIPPSLGIYKAEINGQIVSFNVVKPANFVIDPLKIIPETAVVGKELQASVQITNDGELAGSYKVILKVNGNEINSNEVSLGPGESIAKTASFSPDTSGMNQIEFCGMTQNIKVLKPAEFKATSLKVNPTSLITGESANIEAVITNTGEITDTLPVALMVDGVEKESKSITLSPGGQNSVNFTLSPNVEGACNISVSGASASLIVKALNKYTSKAFFYTVSYPPEFSVDDSTSDTVLIEKADIGGLSILTDFISTADSPQDYFDSIAKMKKQQLPDWNYTSRTEIQENGVIIGYKYDYSNTVNGKKWVGKGQVIKKGGLGYYIVFTTLDSEWGKYENIADICVNSFKTPVTAIGSYSNPNLGVTIVAPSEWTILETANTTFPFVIFSPYNQPFVFGQFIMESVPTGTTTQQYLDGVTNLLVGQGAQASSRVPFIFDDGSSGYEGQASVTSGSQSRKARFIVVINNNKAYSLSYYSTPSGIDSLSAPITQLSKSLKISAPVIAGVNKNETLFLETGEVPTLDPAKTEDSPGDIIGALFSGLVKFDSNLKVVSDLAERWTVSADGKVYTFYLRKNAKFHDGKSVTASDVKYSWERACSPTLKSAKAIYFLNDIVGAKDCLDGKTTGISGIKVVDDYTLEVTIDAPKVYFIEKLTQPVAFIVDKNNASKGANWYELPNGTGPFKLKSWEKNSLLVLEKNNDFYSTPAKLKNIVFKLFSGNPMQLYETGEVDLVGVSLTNLEKVQDKTNPLNKELLTGSSPNIFYLGFNIAKPPFDDLKVRQAFALALDIPKIISVSLKGQAEQASAYIPQGIPGYNPSLQPLAPDPTKAKQLITESKYGSVDKLPPITLYALYAPGPVDQAIVGMWQQNLGVQVKIETVSEYETYFQRQRNDEFQVFTGGWGADYIDPQDFLDVLFQSQSSENGFAYSNPEVDSALIQAAAETDGIKRLQEYQNIEKLILQDLPAAPLYRNSKSYVMVKPYVKGYSLTPIGINLWCDLYVESH